MGTIEASTIQPMFKPPIEKSLILFEQDIHNHFEKRLEIINTTITDYMELRGLSISEMKEGLERIDANGSQSIYYRNHLVVSIQDCFVKEGISLVVKYQINEFLTEEKDDE